jgi:hypothetical protein
MTDTTLQRHNDDVTTPQQEEQHANTISVSEQGSWGLCDVTMTQCRLTATTHDIITVNITVVVPA